MDFEPFTQGVAQLFPELSSALGVLSALITPAVLISACGSLLIATSNRLSRTLDRTRRVSEELEKLAARGEEGGVLKTQIEAQFDQLGWALRRARLLQRAMTGLYLALCSFVGTSIAIGILAATGGHFASLAVMLGLAGVTFLFSSSVILIFESRIALKAIYGETDFIRLRARQLAPVEVVQRAERRLKWRAFGKVFHKHPKPPQPK